MKRLGFAAVAYGCQRRTSQQIASCDADQGTNLGMGKKYPQLGYGSDLYIDNPTTKDLKGLVRAWEQGADVWPWVWTWRNQYGPHHIFVGVNSRVDASIDLLARNPRNNMVVVVASRDDLSERGETYYYDRRCAIVYSSVELFDAASKTLMLEDERIICFDECTFCQPLQRGSPGDAIEWDHTPPVARP